MCHFITSVLPVKSDIGALTHVFNAHGRVVRPLANASIQSQLRPGESYHFTTRGLCDCGTILGRDRYESKVRVRSERARDRDVEKRKKLGWSAAKIESWLRQREASKSGKINARDAELADWRSFLAAIRVSGVPYVGLLIHLYNSPLESEIRLQSRQFVRIADVTDEFLTGMQEDVLYEFRA